MPKLSGTNSVPIARSRYQTSSTPIPESVDEPQQDHGSESKQPLPNTLTRQTRHERGAIPDRVGGYMNVFVSISQILPPAGAENLARTT